MAELLEAVMLICFGVSWPVSVYKSWTSRKTGGKSLLFLLLIDTGYLVGLVGKILYRPGWILVVYSLNLFFVTADMALYFRNRALERQEARG